jgi:hypothetical protein
MTDDKKESFLKKMWGKTIFPEMIKRKKEEKEKYRQIHHEAKLEAMEESKDYIKEAIKQKYKQDEIDKATGAGREKKLQKFANAFKMDGGGLGSTDKINSMLGNKNLGAGNINENNSYKPNQKHKPIRSKRKSKKKQVKTDQFSFEDKINRMLN